MHSGSENNVYILPKPVSDRCLLDFMMFPGNVFFLVHARTYILVVTTMGTDHSTRGRLGAALCVCVCVISAQTEPHTNSSLRVTTASCDTNEFVWLLYL